MTTGEVVRLHKSQVAQAVEVLNRAFFDDPMMTYILPNPQERARRQPGFDRVPLNYGLRYGEVYTTAGEVRGVAVWRRPGDSSMNPVRMLMSGMLLSPFFLGCRAFLRLIRVVNCGKEWYKRNLSAPHWYLWILGVGPPHQGQGLGSALIQPVLQKADITGVRCYLKTMNARNVPFYEKHGFRVVVDTDVVNGALHVWGMMREPRSR